MDATFGDKILFKVNKLKNVKMVVALGMRFDSNAQEFLFTSSVNKKGGYVKFPYPY